LVQVEEELGLLLSPSPCRAFASILLLTRIRTRGDAALLAAFAVDGRFSVDVGLALAALAPAALAPVALALVALVAAENQRVQAVHQRRRRWVVRTAFSSTCLK